MKSHALPPIFKSLMWSHKFDGLDAERDKHEIIVNTINYGELGHWQWLFQHYGKDRLQEIVKNIAASEFRPGALKLMAIFLGLKSLNYASRGDLVSGKTGSVQIDGL